MSFLNPLFLIGIVGAGIPVIIHLYNRKKTVTYKFAAIDFILQSQKHTFGGSKLRNPLLLALRALLLAFLAMAIAKPYISSGRSGLVTNIPDPSSNVLIIDDSFSMSYKVNDKNFFETAKESAMQFVNRSGIMDEFAVIFTSHNNSVRLPELSFDRKPVFDALNNSEISYTETDVLTALKNSFNVLSFSNNKIKRVFIFTDLTKNGWDKENESWNSLINSRTPTVNIVDVSKSQQLNNLYITNVNINKNKDQNIFDIKLTINNYSPLKIIDLTTRIFINNKMYAQGFVNIRPWSSEIKEFSCKPDGEGLITGYAEILPNQPSAEDQLYVDNIRHFIIDKKSDVKTLIIDGDPGVNIYKSETFYIDNALSQGDESSLNINPLVCNVSEFESANLNDFDLLILCNVESVSRSKISELEEFASKGGSILFTLGNKTKADYYNTHLINILPCTLRSVKVLGSDTAESDTASKMPDYTAPRSAFFKRPGKSNIFYDIFADLSDDDIINANFQKIFLIDPDYTFDSGLEYKDLNLFKDAQKAGKGLALLSFSNNLPAIIVKKHGNGLTAVFASTIDRDWNNFSINPIFLPVIQQLCRKLTSLLDFNEYKTDIFVNDEWEIPKDFLLDLNGDKIDSILINRPYGITETMFINKDLNKNKKPAYINTNRPGVYRLTANETQHNPKNPAFVVNLNTSIESNLEKIKMSEIEELIGKERVNFGNNLTDNSKFYDNGTKKNLWGLVLLLVLCIFCAETFFARRSL